MKHHISSVAQLLKLNGHEGSSLHALLQSEGLEKEDANGIVSQLTQTANRSYLRSCEINEVL